ncbi:MAG TPA: GtrA family protein [Candidatus Saccharimonadales bacterium]|nr:GtrA family protein [Candidatus Saccharimonadales bacterium]
MSPRVAHYRPWWRIITYLKEGAILQYLLSGIIVFGADYLAFFASYRLGKIELALATAIAYVIGFVTNFLLLRYWAFARDAQRDYFVTGTFKYGVWLAINYGITYMALKFLQEWLGISPFLGKFVVAFFMTFWNYAGYRFWVFKGPQFHSVHIRV